MVAPPAGVALAGGPAGLGPPPPARRYGAGRAVVQLGRRIDDRDLLRRRRALHVAELARLRLWRLRPGRHGHGGQASRLHVGAGPVAADLRVPRVGRPGTLGGGGRVDGARALSLRASPGRAAGRARRRRGAGRQPGHGDAEPGQHPRLAHDPAVGAGGRRHRVGHPERPLAQRRSGRGVRGAGLPGQDARGLAGAACPRAGLPGRRPGRRGTPDRPAGRHGRDRGRRLVVLHDVRRAHAGLATTVRGRQREQFGVPPGLRLQRFQPGRPGVAQPAPGPDPGDAPLLAGGAAAGVEPALRRELWTRHGVVAPGGTGRLRLGPGPAPPRRRAPISCAPAPCCGACG